MSAPLCMVNMVFGVVQYVENKLFRIDGLDRAIVLKSFGLEMHMHRPEHESVKIQRLNSNEGNLRRRRWRSPLGQSKKRIPFDIIVAAAGIGRLAVAAPSFSRISTAA
jgi:hypothetical protein